MRPNKIAIPFREMRELSDVTRWRENIKGAARDWQRGTKRHARYGVSLFKGCSSDPKQREHFARTA